MIALSAVQSSVRTFFHNAILFIDNSNNAQYKQPHSLIGTPCLAIIASNGYVFVYLLMMVDMEGEGVDEGITWVKWVAVVGVRVSRSVTHGRCAVHLRHLRVQLVHLK